MPFATTGEEPPGPPLLHWVKIVGLPAASTNSCMAEIPWSLAVNIQVLPPCGSTHTAGWVSTGPPCGADTGGEEEPVQVGVVDDAGARPDARLRVRAIGRSTRREVHRPIAAIGVEDLLRAAGEVDRRDVPLEVAGGAGIAAAGDVEEGGAVRGGGDRQVGGALLDGGLERRNLRPAA